ncbi:hypothetical protein EV426DRAFT_616694 [Tirmania nivea]|nr:hypothetical protein EV426DRAFT_616694 [Tirmania nivea]
MPTQLVMAGAGEGDMVAIFIWITANGGKPESPSCLFLLRLPRNLLFLSRYLLHPKTLVASRHRGDYKSNFTLLLRPHIKTLILGFAFSLNHIFVGMISPNLALFRCSGPQYTLRARVAATSCEMPSTPTVRLAGDYGSWYSEREAYFHLPLPALQRQKGKVRSEFPL